MIIGIGTDIVEIKHIYKLLQRFGHKFTERLFTVSERKYCDQKSYSAPFYAKRFAAKEACVKALGVGFSQGITWKDVAVHNLNGGQPTLKVSDAVFRFLNMNFGDSEYFFHLSLSDTRENAVATVVIEK